MDEFEWCDWLISVEFSASSCTFWNPQTLLYQRRELLMVEGPVLAAHALFPLEERRGKRAWLKVAVSFTRHFDLYIPSASISRFTYQRSLLSLGGCFELQVPTSNSISLHEGDWEHSCFKPNLTTFVSLLLIFYKATFNLSQYSNESHLNHSETFNQYLLLGKMWSFEYKNLIPPW